MENCIFCRIAKGDIPAQKVYEDNEVMAILDISPTSPGHTLVIPKRHSENLTEMGERDIQSVFTTVKKIAPAILVAMEADGFNVGMNNYPAAGQTVMHSHVHIIPRKAGDGLIMWPHSKYLEGEIGRIAEKIRRSIES